MKSRQEVDLELVALAQAGDVRAFETLIKRYKTRLTRYLSLLIRDSGDTDDVVQETFMKAYMALGGFRADASFATWLFRIGINTANRNLARRRHRLPQAPEAANDNTGSQQYGIAQADYETPEAKLEIKQVLDQLDAALADLPAEQRTSLVLRELDGLSYEQIAEQMHCPVGTVRSRIHRARDAIAAVLNKN